ncbi:iron ABC transporter permease [Pararhodobacter sp. SW119]|uniref:ABC transporter permease n=1 Tax=Pararhodobacter sp. SW119 TaxID=2780075 RepID=UPI001AE01FC0|nr:iron ABC transporter permease [Pararhodobacter sp. SW119]
MTPGAARRLAGWRPALSAEALLLAALGVYVLGLCVLPLLRLLALVLDGGVTQGAGLLAQTWASPAARTATLNTLDAALWATALSTLLGGGMALLVSLTDVRGRVALVFLLILPLLIPPQVSALAWLSLIGPQSPLWALPGLDGLRPTRNPLLGREGVILVMGIEHAPMVFLALRAGLRALPGELIDAARAAGSRPSGTVVRVVLPLMLPAASAGAALAFVSAIGNFGVPALLGIPGRFPVLSTLIYQRLSGFGPTALPEVAALALILAGIAATGIALQAFALRRFAVPTDRTAGGHRGFTLGRARGPVTAAAWALMTLIALLPLAALGAQALVPSVGVRLTPATATLSNLIEVVTSLGTTRRAFVNSLTLATLAATLTLAAAIPLAWLMARGSRTARLLNLAADAPYVLPGIVLSIAFILTFLPPLPLLGISLYNTLWILLLAYLARFFALALRPVVAALAQLDPALEEAARNVGARGLRRLFTIVLPLVAPAAGAGAILVFLGAFSELTVSALLWSRGNETLGVVIFSLYDEGRTTMAAAVSVWVLAVVLALAGAISLLARRLPEGVLPWQS